MSTRTRQSTFEDHMKRREGRRNNANATFWLRAGEFFAQRHLITGTELETLQRFAQLDRHFAYKVYSLMLHTKPQGEYTFESQKWATISTDITLEDVPKCIEHRIGDIR